jgi:hypothetical protein
MTEGPSRVNRIVCLQFQSETTRKRRAIETENKPIGKSQYSLSSNFQLALRSVLPKFTPSFLFRSRFLMTNVLPQHPYKHIRRFPNLQEPTLRWYPRLVDALRNSLEVLLYVHREDPVLQKLDNWVEEQGPLGVGLLEVPVRWKGRILVQETRLGMPPCGVLIPAMELD